MGLLALFALLLVASAYAQSERKGRWQLGMEMARRVEWGSRRRVMSGGPGSWPPSCRWKCGKCSPCYPVHVPVQPGLREPMEYYPEAWRCKCGGKLYMP